MLATVGEDDVDGCAVGQMFVRLYDPEPKAQHRRAARVPSLSAQYRRLSVKEHGFRTWLTCAPNEPKNTPDVNLGKPHLRGAMLACRISRLPRTHRHINVLGHYSFAVPEAVLQGALRPLRDPATIDALEGL